MITAAGIFNKFKGSGMLHAVTWTPAGGGPGNTFEARLMRGGFSTAPQLSGSELGIQFATDDAADVMQGDTVVLDDNTEYVLRARDEGNCSPDGTLVAYTMRPTL